MKSITNHLFNKADALMEESLTQRVRRQNVIAGNIANSETPGYRSYGYDFERQLQDSVDRGQHMLMKTTDERHIRSPGVSMDGHIKADMYVKPTESIGNDGNSVDRDKEMSDMLSNQILYRATIEALNRRLGLLKYGINGGR